MKNGAFVVWMLGFVLADIMGSYVYEQVLKRQYDVGDRGLNALFFLVIWFGVGCALYEQ